GAARSRPEEPGQEAARTQETRRRELLNTLMGETGDTLRRFAALWSLLVLMMSGAGPCVAQSPPLDPGAADFRPATPTVWFERVWPEALQQKFVIAVDATGQGVYWSFTRSEPVQTSSTGDGKKRKSVAAREPEKPEGIELKREFTLSPANVKLVFAGAE